MLFPYCDTLIIVIHVDIDASYLAHHPVHPLLHAFIPIVAMIMHVTAITIIMLLIITNTIIIIIIVVVAVTLILLLIPVVPVYFIAGQSLLHPCHQYAHA